MNKVLGIIQAAASVAMIAATYLIIMFAARHVSARGVVIMAAILTAADVYLMGNGKRR